MTFEEAYNYCAQNRFNIYFVPSDGPHIITPWFHKYHKDKTFPQLVEELQARVDSEEKNRLELKKLLGREPSYDEVFKGQELIDKLIQAKIVKKSSGIKDDSFKCQECKTVYSDIGCKTCKSDKGFYQ